MKKLSRGAFSMVLAGAVTFSVTNALLVEQLAGDHAVNIFGYELKTNVMSDKTEKNQMPLTNGKDGQNKQKISDINAAPQTAIKNKNKSDTGVAAIQPDTKKPTNEVATNAAKKNTTTITSAAAVTSTKAPRTTPPVTAEPPITAEPPVTAKPASTTKPAEPAKPVRTTIPKKTGNSTNNAATTITNNGQDVSQAAKEKAESRQENKENNGKKM